MTRWPRLTSPRPACDRWVAARVGQVVARDHQDRREGAVIEDGESRYPRLSCRLAPRPAGTSTSRTTDGCRAPRAYVRARSAGYQARSFWREAASSGCTTYIRGRGCPSLLRACSMFGIPGSHRTEPVSGPPGQSNQCARHHEDVITAAPSATNHSPHPRRSGVLRAPRKLNAIEMKVLVVVRDHDGEQHDHRERRRDDRSVSPPIPPGGAARGTRAQRDETPSRTASPYHA